VINIGLLNLNPGKLPRPVHDADLEIPASVLAQVEQALSCSATGSLRTVEEDGLAHLIAKYQPDELMVTGMIHDHAARVRSIKIAAQALGRLQEKCTAA